MEEETREIINPKFANNPVVLTREQLENECCSLWKNPEFREGFDGPLELAAFLWEEAEYS